MQTELPAPSTGTPDIPPSKTGWLINRNFALLTTGQAISNIGDFVYSTTLLIWVYTLTHSAAAVSGVLVAQYIPMFVLGPIAGVFVDRWDRRYTMLFSDLIRAVSALLPIIAPIPLRLPAIFASVFLISTLGRFFGPAKSGVLQVIVTDQQQAQAASISQSIMTISFIIGPAISSPLYFAVGPIAAILINAVSYVVSALFILLMRAPKAVFQPYTQTGSVTRRGIRPIVAELLDGLKLVITSHLLRMIILMLFIAMLGAGALNALEIVFASRNLHMDTSFYGILMTVTGLGMLAGIVIAGLLSRWFTPSHLLNGGVFFCGLGFIVYAFQTWYIAGLIIGFIISIPQGVLNVGFGPLLLNATPKAMMGRVQSVIDTCMSAVSLISVALAGYLGQMIPVSFLIAGCGIIIAISGVFGWLTIKDVAPQEPAIQS